jgi:hypothetical protein
MPIVCGSRSMVDLCCPPSGMSGAGCVKHRCMFWPKGFCYWWMMVTGGEFSILWISQASQVHFLWLTCVAHPQVCQGLAVSNTGVCSGPRVSVTDGWMVTGGEFSILWISQASQVHLLWLTCVAHPQVCQGLAVSNTGVCSGPRVYVTDGWMVTGGESSILWISQASQVHLLEELNMVMCI